MSATSSSSEPAAVSVSVSVTGPGSGSGHYAKGEPACASDILFRPEVLDTIHEEIDRLGPELSELSLKIHSHPELSFKESYAHDTLTTFISQHGFTITPHYLCLDTAWRATFSNSSTHPAQEGPAGRAGRARRVMGVNSEMDALPGVGHACGHNLIAIIGIGVGLALKAALERHNVPGEIVLLGTPAEEDGDGKIILLERGGYEGMDACVMAHPGPGAVKTAGTGPCKAVEYMTVEYIGHTAHASAAPWQGRNALDAAFAAYSNVSLLRQQIHPSHRVHGIVQGRDWAPNIIPDYAKMTWYARAPTWPEAAILKDRIVKCFRAAALATDTEMTITYGAPLFDLAQNPVLAQHFSNVLSQRYGFEVSPTVEGAIGGSTDFGNVTYAVPAIHPSYGPFTISTTPPIPLCTIIDARHASLAIPTEPNGGNHTPAFTRSAATPEAHEASLVIMKALAHTGFRVIDDDAFFDKVKSAFEERRKDMGM